MRHLGRGKPGPYMAGGRREGWWPAAPEWMAAGWVGVAILPSEKFTSTYTIVNGMHLVR